MNVKEILHSIGQSQLQKSAESKSQIAEALNTSVAYFAQQRDLIKADALSARAWQINQEAEDLFQRYESFTKVFVPALLGMLDEQFGIKDREVKRGRKQIPEEVLVGKFYGLAMKLGHAPTWDDMTKAYRAGDLDISPATFDLRFGGREGVQRLVGLDKRKVQETYSPQTQAELMETTAPVTVFDQKDKKRSDRKGKPGPKSPPYSKDELISYFNNLAHQIRRRPSIEDINNIVLRVERQPSIATFYRFFDSLDDVPCSFPVVEKRGVKKNDQYRNQFLEILRESADQGCRPKITDIIKAHKQGKCASRQTFYAYFSSIVEALAEIGL